MTGVRRYFREQTHSSSSRVARDGVLLECSLLSTPYIGSDYENHPTSMHLLHLQYSLHTVAHGASCVDL